MSRAEKVLPEIQNCIAWVGKEGRDKRLLPLFPHAPEIPAETCRSLAEPDDSWGKPGGSSRRAAATTPGESPRKPARGCGDYFWRTSAEAREGRRLLLGEGLREACEGLRRLLLGRAWGSLRGVAETTSGESPRKLAKGCGDYSREKACGSSRRAAETTPGRGLGKAREVARRLRSGANWPRSGAKGQLVAVSGS